MTSAVNAQSNLSKAAVNGKYVIDCKLDKVFYGDFLAVRDSHLPIEKGKITGFIGPSGCGKSTVLRSLNRMNDLIRGFRFEGHVRFAGQDVYASDSDPVVVRRYIGMVFQQPNPFQMTIFDNVAFGLRLNRFKGDLAGRVELALQRAALWDEVKDKLRNSGLSLSGGQQQRLCIARALAVEPELLLMDEPTSALDPVATAKVEDLITQLAPHITIVLVTHDMFQAQRVSHQAAVFLLGEDRVGELVEVGPADLIFQQPTDSRTKAYVSGRL